MNPLDFCSGLLLFLIICFGVVGNVLSFVVWTKGRRCKKLPGSIYLRALAVSDNIALLIPAMNEAVSLVTQVNPKNQYNFLCKVEIVGRHFGLLVSSWIIVCFTAERTLAIFRPSLSTGLISKKGAIILMVVIFLVNFVLNFPFGIVYETTEKTILQPPVESNLNVNVTDNNDSVAVDTGNVVVAIKKVCTADRASFFSYLNWYHIWFMDWVLIFILPFALITGSNLTVLYLVAVRRNIANSKHESRIKSVTMRAVIISIMHCVTTGPFSISVLVPGYFSRALSVKYSQEYYINRVCLILAFLNHAINFLLYSFFGTEFRRDCAEILRKKSAAIHPEGQGTRQSGTGLEDRSSGCDSKRNRNAENSKTDVSTAYT